MSSPTPPIMVVLGNRPQFVKHAAVDRAWRQAVNDGSLPPDARLYVIDTGQHYDYGLAGIFLDELKIPEPDANLEVGSASHAEQLARMLPLLEDAMQRIKPAVVVVYGDTNSTLGGALTAAKLGIPVAHIEAGLRSYDRSMPEEINRVLTDHVSQTLFCPTDNAVANLQREGIVDEDGAPDGIAVRMVGDVMTDIAMLVSEIADRRWPALAQQIGLEAGAYALATIHRAANTTPEALTQLVAALAEVPIPVFFPIHPRTQAAIERAGLHVDLAQLENVHMLPPLGYVDMTAALRNCCLALTDSGGLQKEAYVHGIPCITLRNVTEWVETVTEGMNVLVGTDPAAVRQAVADVLAQPPVDARARAAQLTPVYGRGDAAATIVADLGGMLKSPIWPLST